MRLLFIALILLAVSAPYIQAESLDEAYYSIKSPEELALWLSDNFRPRIVIPDSPQSPAQVLESKEGDCDDFAKLASSILEYINIPNDVLVIKFKGLDIMHAICAFQNQDGTFSFISNRRLYRTGKGSLREAILKFYPDCEKFVRLKK